LNRHIHISKLMMKFGNQFKMKYRNPDCKQ
jgi:hypothetical protein